ncbi:hypothetical protein DL764_010445 [Monosporascus ibericus]|uniref:Uncharacterized protein n=1 Tax=Monosporascus ibericus TaxID=155417 RepID=A0A4Q4STS5_9PEZI|nr:hypothetical protein DL764_010445 [Monosporascus ibericus]
MESLSSTALARLLPFPVRRSKYETFIKDRELVKSALGLIIACGKELGKNLSPVSARLTAWKAADSNPQLGTSTPFPDEAKPLEQRVTDPERIIWTADQLRISKNKTAACLMSQFDVVRRLFTAKQIYEQGEMKAAA